MGVRLNNQPSLTGKTVNKILTTLDAIFQKQLALRVIQYNPVSVAERMATGSNEVGQNDEIDIDDLEVQPEDVYNPEQLARFLGSTVPGFDRTILTVYAMTGARHGERLALMWRDQGQAEIIVRRDWSDEFRDGEPVFSTPKTKHSIRRIPSSAELSLELKKWKLQCPPSKYDLMFPQADGRHITEKRSGEHSTGQLRKPMRMRAKTKNYGASRFTRYATPLHGFT